MDRREFSRLCSGLLAGAAVMHAQADGAHLPYQRSHLTLADHSPVSVNDLDPGNAYIFSYPYVCTPCFLLRLHSSANRQGQWPGGVGDDHSVVAFSAICSHKLSHPAKPISHINYRPDTVTFDDENGVRKQQQQVISCCSERSVYDPLAAGAVLSGPATQPLAAISLQVTDAGTLVATGSLGANQYDRFLSSFGFRLAMEYGVTDVRARTGESTVTIPADKFSSQQIRC